MKLDFSNVKGMDFFNLSKVQKLAEILENHQSKNEIKTKYYEGNIKLSDVNLGIAIPKQFEKLDIGCEWGSKCVDVLANRSMFDGFVGVKGDENDVLKKLVKDNNLITEYNKACKDELKLGTSFATLSADDQIGCKVRFHSSKTASAMWNGEKGRIDCGLAIIDSRFDESDKKYKPSLVNYYTDDDIWVLHRIETHWIAEQYPHSMGRPLMEPMIWDATSDKPFGRSRIKSSIRNMIDSYVRTLANTAVALEFATAPQKYLLGVTDEQYDAISQTKFNQYIGSILTSTTNPETGDNPVFGQLPQGNIEPHVQSLKMLASQFSAASGLSVSDTGVVNDANPTSSDAILAQTQTLIGLAEDLNENNSNALVTIALMALAIINKTTIEDLSDEQKDIIAHFKNPALPSVAATADAATKIAATRPSFAETDVYLEMIGFSQADIRRIKNQEQRGRGERILNEEFRNADKSRRVGQVYNADVSDQQSSIRADETMDRTTRN